MVLYGRSGSGRNSRSASSEQTAFRHCRGRIRAYDGTVLELDANRLKMFTTNEGIYGEFELVTTMENKFVELRQLS